MCPIRSEFKFNPETGHIEQERNLCVVGCTNVAIGMIMSYYECPKTYGNSTLDWPSMKTWESYMPIPEGTSVPWLLRELGKSGNMNTDYGIHSSSTQTKRYYKRTFKTFEYHEPSDFSSFSTDELRKWIMKPKPVLVRGNNDDGEGHVWVIDGLHCDMWKYTNAIGDQVIYGDGLFFHVVWGWGGQCNGYFKHGSGFTEVSFKYTDPFDPQKLDWDMSEDYNSWYEKVKIYNLEFCGDFNPR